MYKLTSVYNMSIRKSHGVEHDRIAQLNAGQTAIGDEIYTVIKDAQYMKIGDQWLHITIPRDGWIAIKHLGRIYSTVIDIAIQPKLDVTSIMREIIRNGGCIASLKHDWDIIPPPKRSSKAKLLPETVQFNSRPMMGKGEKVKLTDYMRKYALSLNSAEGNKAWQEPKTGLINNGNSPEALSFGGNTVLVKSIYKNFANVWAVPYDCKNIDAAYFSENGRIAVMKLTASNVNTQRVYKVGNGVDVYFPFISNQPDYYVPLDRIEFWKELPFELNKKTVIEYSMTGNDIYGVFSDGDRILLYSDKVGFTTKWKIETTLPPS